MKKLLSFGTCLALGLTVVGTSASFAAKYYFDNSTTAWENPCVWGWVAGDDMWAMDAGFTAWPGIPMEQDAATSYYVAELSDDLIVDGVNIMFNGNDGGVQTNDAAAAGAAVDHVCVPADVDADGKYNATWEAVGAAETPAETPADDTASDGTASDDTTADAPADDATTDVTPAPEAPAAPEAGKTADAAPIAAVAVLGLVSMAVVVATRKKIA